LPRQTSSPARSGAFGATSPRRGEDHESHPMIPVIILSPSGRGAERSEAERAGKRDLSQQSAFSSRFGLE